MISAKPGGVRMGLALFAGALSIGTACSTNGRAPWLSSEPEGVHPIDLGGGIETCNEEGEIRDCSEKIGLGDNNVVTCKRGIQECRRGMWSRCGEESVIFLTRQVGLTNDSPPACADNPCSPECMGFDESQPTPITNPSGPGFSFEGNPNEWGNAPGGFESKQDCGRASGGCLHGYPKGCGGAPTHYNRFDGCQADHRCDADTNRCVRNEAGWTWPANICAGVDLSVGPACHNGQNHGFPVCNRGNTSLGANVPIKIAITNGNAYELTCPIVTKGTVCTVKSPTPLQPGECLRVVNGGSCTWSGNAVAYVNSDLSITECGMPLRSPAESAIQPGCSNNWSDVKTGATCQIFVEEGAYEPMTVVEEYTAVCPVGTRPKWGLLVYEAVTPCSPAACDGSNAASVKFEMQTAPSWDSTTYSNWITAAHAPAPTHTHPSSCRTSGPDPCPVTLSSVLPSPAHEHLRLRVTLTPSPDGKAFASLSQWQLTYDCGAYE